MEAKNLASITEQLERERESLTAKMEKARAELVSLESEFRRISNAIDALNGTPAPAGLTKRGGGKPKKELKSKSPSKADVIRVARSILKDKGVLEAEALKQLVEGALIQEGFNRNGFSLRFKEALADGQFVDTPGGIRLGEPKALAR